MIFPSIANPWVLLAAALAIGAAYLSGDIQGAKRGANAVRVEWDAERARQADIARENQRLVSRASDNLQRGMDDDRKKTAVALAGLESDVARLTRSLQQRENRPPADGRAASAPAKPGPAICTGLGLYREDGLFLVGEAATAKRIKLQRDSCYTAYSRAEEEIARLQEQLSGRPK